MAIVYGTFHIQISIVKPLFLKMDKAWPSLPPIPWTQMQTDAQLECNVRILLISLEVENFPKRLLLHFVSIVTNLGTILLGIGVSMLYCWYAGVRYWVMG